jgi:hypothetical protein
MKTHSLKQRLDGSHSLSTGGLRKRLPIDRAKATCREKSKRDVRPAALSISLRLNGSVALSCPSPFFLGTINLGNGFLTCRYCW